jgi:hypothetical protein
MNGIVSGISLISASRKQRNIRRINTDHEVIELKDDVVTVKEIVEKILKEDERSRNDDKWLILQTLRKMNYKIYIPFKEMESMPAFESITRCRRKFQEQGLYPASDKITEQRTEEKHKMTRIDEWFNGE